MSKPDSGMEKIYVVSHTHWDREWYQDFQGFRARLVYMMDELIAHMESDPEYRHFTLDGQTIVLDDYLDIRPENRERLERLIRSGRIAIGPWYVMPDEFLVSGESLIRNLAKGMRQARAWGVQPMASGYVTDIFGHNSQLPQILRGFGIDNAVLFRGFNGDADTAEIWWEAADGSRVLGLKLDEDRCYSDFYFALRWPFYDRGSDYEAHREELLERAEAWLAFKRRRATTPIGIGLDGVDHIEIEPRLGWLLRELNASDRLDTTFEHAHLSDYLAALRAGIGELPVYKGELKVQGYTGVNNWVPENTLSSRVHLKQMNHRCETLLEKWAEPLGVMTALDGRPYPRRFLAKSWGYLLQNHPHDSICGCSIDQVHRDMLYRFDQSRLIAEQMTREQMEYVTAHLDGNALQGRASLTLFNPAQTPVNGVVEAELTLPAGTDAAVAMKELRGTSFRLCDSGGQETPHQLLDIRAGSFERSRPYRDLPRGEAVDRFRIALKAKVPAYGYAVYTLEKFTIVHPETGEYSAPRLVAPVRYLGAMQVDDNVWENGAVRLEAMSDGTLALTDLRSGRVYGNLLTFEDEADIGDGWSHVAPPGNETFRSTGTRAEISTVWDGPLCARLRVRTRLRVPARIQPGDLRRSDDLTEIELTTDIDLRKDDPLVTCRTSVRNTARDHRLKVLFPTAMRTDVYHTNTAFDLVRRPIPRPDWTDRLRKDFDVVPYNGIVALEDDTGGLAVYSQGLYEAVVRDNRSRTIALTLFRSTNKEVMTDGGDSGQLLGELEFRYALRPFAAADENRAALLWKEYQAYAAGIRSVNRKADANPSFKSIPHSREASLPLERSFLRVDSDGLIVSAVKAAEDAEDAYVVRLFNALDRATEGRLTFDRPLVSAHEVDLDERSESALAFADGSLTIAAAPKRIVTLLVRFG